MTRQDLVKRIAEKTNFTLDNSEIAAEAFLAVLTEAVKAHEKIVFHGLLTLKPTVKSARRCYNPQTHEPMDVPAKNAYRLLMSPQVLAAINADGSEE